MGCLIPLVKHKLFKRSALLWGISCELHFSVAIIFIAVPCHCCDPFSVWTWFKYNPKRRFFQNIRHECHIAPLDCGCPTLALIECFQTPNAFALWCQTSILCSPVSHPPGSFHGFPRTSPYVLLEGLTVAHWMKSLGQQGACHEGWLWHLQRIDVSHLVKWK